MKENKKKNLIIDLLIIILIVMLLMFGSHPVSGASMEPTYHNKERVFTLRTLLPVFKFEQGDIAVVYLKEDRELLIKRIAAIPGDTLVIKADGSVEVNGIVYEYGTGSALMTPVINGMQQGFDNSYSITLGDDEYYVLGDNRENSLDSRYFGPFSRKELIEKVLTDK